ECGAVGGSGLRQNSGNASRSSAILVNSAISHCRSFAPRGMRMPVNPLLIALSDADRAAAEGLLLDFEKKWSDERLIELAPQLAGATRLAVLGECVRIDRERRGGRALQWYFARFPELQSEPIRSFL